MNLDFRFIIASGDGEENSGCRLELGFLKWTKYIKIPALLKPTRKKVYPKSWDAATVKRLGRDWYWDYTELAYGVYLFGSHFNILYGNRTDDSSTEQRWSCFLPFASWRFVRHSLYNLEGRHVWSQKGRGKAKNLFDDLQKQRDKLQKAVFSIKDYDGEELTATTFIEEREWRFGEGWFKWMSLFVPRKINRSLDIWFSKETGERKGSWKGGTLGHSITMIEGDSPEWAFRRYCAAHHMTFIERVESPNRDRMAA